MSWIYVKSEQKLWTVGFYDPSGAWHSDSDHASAADAARRCHWLNGGDAPSARRGEGRMSSPNCPECGDAPHFGECEKPASPAVACGGKGYRMVECKDETCGHHRYGPHDHSIGCGVTPCPDCAPAAAPGQGSQPVDASGNLVWPPAAVDERAEFEAWAKRWCEEHSYPWTFKRAAPHDVYADFSVHTMWAAWQAARAKARR